MRIDNYNLASIDQVEWRARESGISIPSYGVTRENFFPDESIMSIEPPSANSWSDTIMPKATPRLIQDIDMMNRAQLQSLARLRLAFIGEGAGSIILASYLVLRGADPAKITFTDPGKTGGIWSNANVRMGGFNNPAPLFFDNSHFLSTNDRSGNKMHAFLNDISSDYLVESSRLRASAAWLMRKRFFSNEWRVGLDDGDVVTASTVVVSTGRPIPRKLDGPRIKSNLDRISARHQNKLKSIEHEQRILTEEELSSGRPIILVGLGNSTAAMLNQIQRYEDKTDKDVDYRVLTDYPSRAINFPNHPYSENGKTLFRQPSVGYLTGYSGDLNRDRRSLQRAVAENKVATGINRIMLDEVSRKLFYSGREHHEEFTANDSLIFILIGFDRDNSLINPHINRSHNPIRMCDGAISTRRDGYMSNLFAIGSFAATSANPNAAVIPGIFAQTPGTALTIAVRSCK